MSAPAPSPPVSSTYRLQLRSDFGFREAAALVPYLARLGISHVYCSPYLRARAGSTHGYDITDHGALNPEIGDEQDLLHFVEALRSHGMGQILDFVPNHMGVAQADNAWWLDVLEYGAASPWAGSFDIDWRPARSELRGRVLAPFLGDHYGRVLEAGELEVAFDPEGGGADVWYYVHRFPLSPPSLGRLLQPTLERVAAALGPDHAAAVALERVLADLAHPLGPGRSAARRDEAHARAEAAKRDLARLAAAEPAIREAIEAELGALRGEPGRPASWRPLHRLLERQHYRLAYWRVASDEINYRRFFDVNELAALRMERRDVFERTHGRVLGWIRDGLLDGLRIDHIDGLYDPLGYCQRLREATAERPIYLVVEKILAHHESLRGEWPVDGTTGYEFMTLLGGLFVDAAGERGLERTWRRFAPDAPSIADEIYACKKHVLNFLLGGELSVLSHALHELSESHWTTRDFTETTLREALKEVVACFPVYRSYVRSEGPSSEDRRDIDWAVAQARRRSSDPEPSLFDWIHRALKAELGPTAAGGWPRREVLRFAMRFQQLSGPVMAKALEDTAFYRQHRLVSLNDVGGEPERFGTTPSAFHHVNAERLRHWPRSMLATATHDHKRGEDVRLRIHAISELSTEWDEHVRRWARWNRRARKPVDGAPAPAGDDEYFLYQILLGTWPEPDGRAPDGSTPWLAGWSERVQGYLVKALREAKKRSSWRHPDARYEEAVLEFVRRLLAADRPNPFLADLAGFAARVAAVAAVHALSHTALKLAAPGVPDTYQGCELFDLSMADPDNRRAVDFAVRVGALAALDPGEGAARPVVAPAEVLRSWRDGRAKLLVTARLLALRRRFPELLVAGGYQALEPAGSHAERVMALLRHDDVGRLAVVAPRLVAPLLPPDAGLRIPPDAWKDTTLPLPPALHGEGWRDLVSGAVRAPQEGAALQLAELLADFPVALLWDGPAGTPVTSTDRG